VAFKLKYDAAADRMRVVVGGESGPPRVFWLQRNQCLGLLAKLGEVGRQLGVPPHSPTAPRSLSGPRENAAGLEDAVPEALDGIRVRIEGEGARVLFVQGDRTVGLFLQPAGLGRLQEMLGMQAERAGWDPAAGLARLQAQATARVTISKTRQRAAGDQPREP
jgi:hypothetical protein